VSHQPRPERRRARIGAALIAVLLVAGCDPAPSPSPTAAAITQPPATPIPTPSPSPADTPVPSAGPVSDAIDGMPMPAGRPSLPIAVMIDDNIVARPQSGFNAAAVVYQAPADGGEDRYMLVFQDEVASTIGPVRSGRPYFVHWACEFRAGFAHYGGDLKTLTQVIPPLAGTLMFNLDALADANDAFHRVKTVKAPHNAYTSTDDLRATATRLGAPDAMVGGLEAWTFRDDRPAAQRPASGKISIPYRTGTTSYAYDASTNSYLRSIAGKAQIDPLDGKRVTARNVVVLFMALSVDPESEPGHHRPVLDHIGDGTAVVFRDGEVITGTWRKDSIGALTRFFDASGTEIQLVRGPIFIQVVPTGTSLSYSMG
jgi:hypothetical protein